MDDRQKIIRSQDTRHERLRLIHEALANKNGGPRRGMIPEQLLSTTNPPIVRQTSMRGRQAVRNKPITNTRHNHAPVVHETNEYRLIQEVNQFIQTNSDFYTGLGGMGDALLTLAAAWRNPRAKIFFFANMCSLDFINKFFAAFEVNSHVVPNIMGQPWAGRVIQVLRNHPGFQTSAHLADGLDYADWRNIDKYKQRIVTHADWLDKFGKQPNPFGTRGVITICPSGSVKDRHRQRYLSKDEYEEIARRFLEKNYTVYTVSSEDDLRVYGVIEHPHAMFVTSDRIVDYRKHNRPIKLQDMLRIINSSERVISMDTWLKTYCLIAGIPTHVIMTRWNGKYKPLGEDVTDFIFLDPRIWPSIQLTTVESVKSW